MVKRVKIGEVGKVVDTGDAADRKQQVNKRERTGRRGKEQGTAQAGTLGSGGTAGGEWTWHAVQGGRRLCEKGPVQESSYWEMAVKKGARRSPWQ